MSTGSDHGRDDCRCVVCVPPSREGHAPACRCRICRPADELPESLTDPGRDELPVWVTAPTPGGMVATYGGRLAHVYWSTDGRWLSVHLLRDPGTGSMTHVRISPSCVRLVAADPSDVATMRDRLSRSLDYLTPGGPGAAWVSAELARLDTPGEVLPLPIRA